MRLSRSVVEHEAGFPCDSGQVEGVVHQEKHVRVVRVRLVSDKRAEHHQPGDLPRRPRQPTDPLQTRRDDPAVGADFPESMNDFG